MSRRTTLTVVAVVVAAAVVAVVALAGGGGTGLAPEAGTGQVEEVSPGVAVVPDGQRQPLPAFTGRTLDNQRDRPGQPAGPAPGAELLGVLVRALPGRAGGP